MQLEVENSIVSLSGSNPLHQRSMQHVQQLGIVVYLDVQQSDILKRLHEMKVRDLDNCKTNLRQIFCGQKYYFTSLFN